MTILDGHGNRVRGRASASGWRALLAVALLIGGSRSVWAHQDPVGCSGTGVQLSFTAYRADGNPIDLSETVTECETITYQVVIGKSTIGNPCAFEGGSIKITTPDGVIHDVTPGGGVPCIGGTGACSTTTFNSLTVNYTVNTGDVVGGQVTAASSYAAALSHTGTSHTMGFPQASTTLPLTVEFCPTDTPCVDNFCDPNLFDSSTGALGNCTFQNVPNSTPCPDIDGSQCTAAGCDGQGNCDQNHQVTVCPPDGNPCTNDAGCDTASGACIYTNLPNSSPCPDNDGSLCTTAGCDGFGNCEQGHQVTICPPDGNACTFDGGCDSTTGACIYDPVPDSTPCPDIDGQSCTTAGCEVGQCVQSHMSSGCAIDHFQCYELKRGAFAGPTVNLVDTFGTFNGVAVQRPERLCNPADKNDEDNSAPTHEDHLVGYKVRFTSAPHPNQRIVDQFGTHFLDVTKVDRLLIPAAKGMAGPPPPLTPPTVDHFTCYKVRKTKGTASFTKVGGVKVDDQFGTLTVTVNKPKRFCVPSDKNLENPGAETHTLQSLLCYKTSKLPSPVVSPTVSDQIGTRNVQVIRREELCVPAALNP